MCIMTKQEIMTNCLKQMIFDEFLSIYGDAIKVLLKNQSILYTVRRIHQGVSEQIEFCADNTNLELKKFKNNIGEMFYESQAYLHIPEYRFIVDDVRKKGIAARGTPYAMKSAAISTYYAIRFYEISKTGRE